MNNRPVITTLHSAGADLTAYESIIIPAKGRAMVRTGYKYDVGVPGTVGLVRSRSGLAFKSGITAFHGTIDPDYTQEIMVLLFNHTEVDYKVNEGQRIAQLIIIRQHTADFFDTDETQRQDGFGSTGR